jgi:hypothetical protein
MEMIIVNLLGQPIYSENFDFSGYLTRFYDKKIGFKQGIYIVQIRGNGKTVYKKMVID